MTATLFNYSYRPLPAQARDTSSAPAAVRKIVIIGGGSAGWMTALIFARSLLHKGVEITVVESPTVGIIGVGEGSTPWLRGFFDSLGIEEAEWMPACHATYKCGITFDGWSTKPGYTSYFHPFASMLDNLTMTQFVHNADARVNGANLHAHPNRFFIAARLAAGRLAPKPAEHFPFDIWHGYHFDAALLGQFLQGKALHPGVLRSIRHVTHTTLDASGAIESVSTEEGDRLTADLFVDCTGFPGLLTDRALGTPFVSLPTNLFNDPPLAIPSPTDPPLTSHTSSPPPTPPTAHPTPPPC